MPPPKSASLSWNHSIPIGSKTPIWCAKIQDVIFDGVSQPTPPSTSFYENLDRMRGLQV